MAAYDLTDAADELNDVFYDLGDSLDWISDNSSLVENQLDTSTCTQGASIDANLLSAKNDLTTGISSLTDAIDALASLIDPVPKQIDRLKDAIVKYAHGHLQDIRTFCLLRRCGCAHDPLCTWCVFAI